MEDWGFDQQKYFSFHIMQSAVKGVLMSFLSKDNAGPE